jgi:Fe-Mn family superoxide dismutase
MNISVTPLQYTFSDLEPCMSRQTVELHHTKHEQGYANKLNELYQGDLPLIEIVREFATRPEKKIYNNAGQLLNHHFFWQSLTPKYQKPQGQLLDTINDSFGSFDKMVASFIEQGTAHFGSGWVWLVASNGSLQIMTTANADSPITTPNVEILLAIDIWEHAYYLDYTYQRGEFIKNTVEKLANWEYASQRLAAIR